MAIRAPKANDLVRDCLALLRLRGVAAFRMNTGAANFGDRYVRFGDPGAPDIMGVLPAHRQGDAVHPAGRLIACECKTGTGRLSAAQRAWHAAARAAGALVLTVRSVGELDDALKEVLP